LSKNKEEGKRKRPQRNFWGMSVLTPKQMLTRERVYCQQAENPMESVVKSAKKKNGEEKNWTPLVSQYWGTAWGGGKEGEKGISGRGQKKGGERAEGREEEAGAESIGLDLVGKELQKAKGSRVKYGLR